jgi:hypothetical protein
MWDKLKHGTLQILEELTAPPTVGAVSGHQFITTIKIQIQCVEHRS